MSEKNKRKFDAIALIATMRSGSNLLERILSQHPQLVATGELFNPHFIGSRNNSEFEGFSITQRKQDPEKFLDLVLDAYSPKIPIFRYFHDHDPEALDAIVENPRIAKLLLRRNPLRSFISVELAKRTDQWILGRREKNQKSEKFEFDVAAFNKWKTETSSFYETITEKTYLHQQALFSIDYEDAKNLSELNALTEFLELDRGFDYFFEPIPKQNPKSVERYLTNPEILKTIELPQDPTPKLDDRIWKTPLDKGYYAPKLRLIYVPIRGTGVKSEIEALRKAEGAHLQEVDCDAILKLIDQDPNIMCYTRVTDPRLRLYTLMLENILEREKDFDIDFKELSVRELSWAYEKAPQSSTRQDFAEVGLSPRFIRRMLREFSIFIRQQNWSGKRNELISDLYWPQKLLVDSFERIAPLRVVVGEGYPDEMRFEPLKEYTPIIDPLLKIPTDAKELLHAFADQQLYDLYREDYEQYNFEIAPKRLFAG